ncbi:hypothetical protein HCA00_04720 [Listeria booriae]|uniref:hypothetical protein n=1 Tax=Listeria booriae TaxID=1552123 RepID=UPI00164EBF7F|nr:hypothetical protein [Listeria booriae]MBC6128086.1 hypothetical protein [Listeria booriae]
MKAISYQELMKYFKQKNIEIVNKKCHDAQSGWTGMNRYVRDRNGFLNENGEYTDEPSWGTIDLSLNGYCFSESSVFTKLKVIQEFYEIDKVKTFEDFRNYIDTSNRMQRE